MNGTQPAEASMKPNLSLRELLGNFVGDQISKREERLHSAVARVWLRSTSNSLRNSGQPAPV